MLGWQASSHPSKTAEPSNTVSRQPKTLPSRAKPFRYTVLPGIPERGLHRAHLQGSNCRWKLRTILKRPTPGCAHQHQFTCDPDFGKGSADSWHVAGLVETAGDRNQ